MRYLLKEQLVAKNSRNSSKPPSTEIVPPKRTVSLRKATGRSGPDTRGTT